jgi:phthiocerol/phenolphthiocerol synthesis type-I polyketide synthase C
VLDRKEAAGEPIARAIATAMASGARVNETLAFGRVCGPVDLPWQRKPYSLAETIETNGLISPRPWHPLIGARSTADRLEWTAQVDPQLVPELADHKIDGTVLLPGSAFVEMALAVARSWLETDEATVAEVNIQQPMHFTGEMSREVLCRISPDTRILEILSRPGLGHTAWQTHATAKIIVGTGYSEPNVGLPHDFIRQISGRDLYLAANAAGLQFGPSFQNVALAGMSRDNRIVVDLRKGHPTSYWLDPARLDSCFHGIRRL